MMLSKDLLMYHENVLLSNICSKPKDTTMSIDLTRVPILLSLNTLNPAQSCKKIIVGH